LRRQGATHLIGELVEQGLGLIEQVLPSLEQ
jgi:hypothetical protein